ncbi:hypothetical protein B9Z55_000686 [Caenorhabditis nigoni]|uniref:Uncharacterized protein n=1 Tax=Caenorhabditis nigoni TaxID=1611254 RepID=A0A2G5VV09_9PELO|nr:hypothetical protein B9Z55_000686 [Caenorhabditis nigoni]
MSKISILITNHEFLSPRFINLIMTSGFDSTAAAGSAPSGDSAAVSENALYCTEFSLERMSETLFMTENNFRKLKHIFRLSG